MSEESIRGVIQSRRCHGKHLSFATILLDPPETTKTTVKVMFRRANFEPSALHNFPTKLSELPYGGLVELRVQWVPDREAYEVKAWTLTGEHPRQRALRLAQSDNGDGVVCSKYLQERSKAFLELNHDTMQNRGPKQKKQTPTGASFDSTQGKGQHRSSDDTDGHSGENAKTRGLRAQIFAQWLLENVLRKSNQHIVLDVAGGKGHLAVALAKAGIPGTVVDPLIRSGRNLRKLQKSQQKVAITSTTSTLPSFLASRFEKDARTAELLQNYTCLVGFHPDECTEDILDMALQHDKMVAVVPCCVFPSFFPLRRLENGVMVNTYDEFLQFLMQKDPRLKKAELPFSGKNQVIYFSG